MNLPRFFSSALKYAHVFAKWLLCSVAVGLVCGGIGVLFHFAVDYVAELRGENSWLLYLLPVAGLIIAALYRLFKMEDDGGTNHIFQSIRTGERVPLRMAPLIFIGTTLTHLCGGSSGREGAALQIGGSVSAFFGHLLRFDEKDMRVMTMCGMSAVFSALFGTPLTAALFCIEVISIGIFHFSALVPCMVSSLTAFLLARALGVPAMAFSLTQAPNVFTAGFAVRVLILSALCAVISILVCVSLHGSAKLYKKYIPNSYIRVAVGGLLTIGLTLLVGSGDYNGAGMGVITKAIGGDALPYAFVLKLVFTAVALGAGFKGGEIIPTMFIGATFGCTVGKLLLLDPGFAAAIGLVAVFCGVVNCPISCIMLSVELFGGDNVLYFAFACAISYMLSGRFSLYSAQKIVYSKLEPTYINADAQ